MYDMRGSCWVSGMPRAHPEVSEVFAETNSQAVLPCKCSPSSPSPPGITWSKEAKGTVWKRERSGIQLWGARWSEKGVRRIQCPHSKFEKGDCSLQINNVREEDGGVYVCRLDRKQQAVEYVVLLIILKVSFSPAAPIAGNDVSVTCSVTPQPSGATVQWRLNNRPFRLSNEITSSSDTVKHVVTESATTRLTGQWTCVVSYNGKEGQASANVSVKGIIHPLTDNTKVYAAVGSAVTLPCVFSPGLIPSEPVWQKLRPGSLFKPAPGSPLPSSSSSSHFAGDKSLLLKEVRFEDEGRYRCSGSNEGQKLTRNLQLVVAKIVSSLPSKNSKLLTLICKLSDSSEVTNYEWVHVTYDLNGTKSFGSIQKGNTLRINKGSAENAGEWACRFYDKKELLGNVTYHVPLMGRLSGQTSTGLSHNTTAVVGLSVLLLVLLLILAQMYKNHRRRKRIFQYPAMETIIHTISNEREWRENTEVKE
ncbi:lymphocyte activation gene 3 protein [Aulostomus maculatus]